MSETGKKGSKPKPPPAAKSESKAKAADGGKKTTEAKTTEAKTAEAKPTDAKAKPADGASSEAASSGGGAGAGKSARESVGGAKDVHYGYFSSVRSPAYRSGWDEIWGGGAHASRTTGRAPKPRKKPRPITLALDLDDLPPPLKDGLIEIARAELKKSRVSYERREKAGAVDWRIVCRIDR